MIKERIKLKEEDMLNFIRGKKLIFHYHDVIEIVTLTYDEWKHILKEFIPCSSESFDLVDKINSKFWRIN